MTGLCSAKLVSVIIFFMCKLAEKVRSRKLVQTSTEHSRIGSSKVQPVEGIQIKGTRGSGDNHINNSHCMY